jgi:hypothetical protein
MSHYGHLLRLDSGNGWDARREMLTGWCACVRDPLCWWDRHLDVLRGLPATRGKQARPV